ncbi:protein-serine O-palmitoleoyltransferase porcupine [Caerostris extrusa]|uniref:Protein-serine O-palmitoleoyltransferase porcupine n=1 Tax=Caerostris extrusa TaxID=172846 RepID=A0AAV4UK92_CAEEX|nr:protein-serine O-palmitoleoyltransferase porcupine [Caerostris extrusa]
MTPGGLDFDFDLSDLSYEDLFEDYSDLFSNPSYTLLDLLSDCLLPTLYDGFWSCAKLICCSLFLKFTISLRFLPDFAFHVTSSCLGIICALFCFIFLIICELFFADKTMWHRIRGCQMILAMKIISLGFDSRYTCSDMPAILPCFGYLFHIGTVIFGPWISYSSYIGSKDDHKIDLPWFYNILRCVSLSFGFLTVSTCWTSWVFSTDLIWIDAYRDALSFRSSHYFVSYISEVTATLSGVRSCGVVECANAFWLKTYVFKTAKPLGSFAAILLTYAASSLLHGLNFQLAAVLLSLGFYTYIEHVFRKKLADIFKACILARKCKSNCDHIFKSDHMYVRMVNIGFGLLAMFHLAYLGVMFDSSSSIEEEGYNMSHTLEKWSELDFTSHWVALFSYIFYYLV